MDNESNYFKIIFFSIDSYITKPHLILDETYSTYRKRNINLATVVRIFGSTENGIKTCVHIHQYCPHLSIRQRDLAAAYKIILDVKNPTIDQEILNIFVKDIEDELHKYINSKSKDEILILNIENYSSRSFYGYHDEPEIFYKIYFSSYWMANEAKNLLESGLINNYQFVCHNFLEFLLQFYIDNRIYLNEICFKKVTFRKRKEWKHFNGNVFELIQERKLRSIKNILRYNDLPPSTTCSLECDALLGDIILLENKKKFPENPIFNPSIPGIVKLWNNQFERYPKDFGNLLKTLKNPENKNNLYEQNCQFIQLKKSYLIDAIPQLDGQNDDDQNSKRTFCIFQKKRIEIIPEKFKNGLVYCQKVNCFPEKSKNNLLFNVGKSGISIKQITKYQLLQSIDKKIKLFHCSKIYLNKLKENLKTYRSKNSLVEKTTDSKLNETLKLNFLNTDNQNSSTLQSTPKRLKKFTTLNKSSDFQKSFFGQFFQNKLLDFSLHQEKFLLSNDSILKSSNPKNESFQFFNGNFKWSQCLNLTLMSLELHSRIRENLTPDPNFDPIQIVVFSVYEEFLKNTSDLLKKKSNVLYFGAIIVHPKRLEGNETIILNTNKNLVIDYVSSECNLFTKLSYYVTNFDPDILLGYMVDTFSWGYLLQRAVNLNIDIGPLYSRIINCYQSKSKNFPGCLNSAPKLTGRIVFNTWRLLRHELCLRSYSFENVFYHLFQKRFPKYTNKFLNILWKKFILNRNELCKYLILEYYFYRVWGSLKILTHLDFIRRTFDLSCLFGMQFQDVIERGSQFRVESMLFPLCSNENFIPIRFSKNFIAQQNAPQATPLIFEPELSFHKEPVAVFDFQSLYPSIMIAHNYCFSTCLGRMQNIISNDNSFGCYKLGINKNTLKKLNEHFHLAPNDVLFVKPNVRQGIIPKMLEEILNTRILIKNELKNINRKLLENNNQKELKALKRQLDVSQLGLKLISNVTYGYTSANFSGRMPCVEIADSIVSKGRETLEEVTAFINEWGKKSGTKATVIYGDTDSVFVSFPNTSITNAFEMANFILEEINKRQPYPVCLKLEKIYKPSIILAKKRYCGYSYENANSDPIFDAKGIETIRRDNCNLTAKIMEKCIKLLFETNGNIESLKPYLQWEFKKILWGRIGQLHNFIFAREFSGFANYYNESIISACIIARKRIQVDPMNEPKFKERVPYVIIEGQVGLKLADLVREPFDLLTDKSLKLNTNYYIKNAIIPPLARVLDSIINDGFSCLISWYEEMKNSNMKMLNWKHIERFHFKHKQQQLFNDQWKLKININDNQMKLYSKSSTLILDSLWIIGQKLKQLERTCWHCAQNNIHMVNSLSGKESNQFHQCIVDSCPILNRFYQAQQDFFYLCFLDRALLWQLSMPQ